MELGIKMIKISADVKAILRTHIKTELEILKKLLVDKTKTDDQRIKEIDQIIYRLQSLVDANVPNETAATPGTTTSGTAAADDNKTKVPAFFRKNLDYGSRK